MGVVGRCWGVGLEESVRGLPAGVCVRVNGPVLVSMCDPPSSRQPALAHTWASLHAGTVGSRVRGRVGKTTTAKYWLQGQKRPLSPV